MRRISTFTADDENGEVDVEKSSDNLLRAIKEESHPYDSSMNSDNVNAFKEKPFTLDDLEKLPATPVSASEIKSKKKGSSSAPSRRTTPSTSHRQVAAAEDHDGDSFDESETMMATNPQAFKEAKIQHEKDLKRRNLEAAVEEEQLSPVEKKLMDRMNEFVIWDASTGEVDEEATYRLVSLEHLYLPIYI